MARRIFLCLMGLFLLGACAAGGAATVQTAAPPTMLPTSPPATPAPVTPTRRSQPSVSSATVGLSTPSTTAYPIGCTTAEVEVFLGRFLDAFNRGDIDALHTFFPLVAAPTVAPGLPGGDYSGEKFVWYSMTDERLDFSNRHFVTFDLPALWTYFAERHAHQERLRLATLRVGRQDAIVANLEVNFYRSADDLPPDAGFPPGQATGKAVINCRYQKILVMSLGQGSGRGTPTPSRP